MARDHDEPRRTGLFDKAREHDADFTHGDAGRQPDEADVLLTTLRNMINTQYVQADDGGSTGPDVDVDYGTSGE